MDRRKGHPSSVEDVGNLDQEDPLADDELVVVVDTFVEEVVAAEAEVHSLTERQLLAVSECTIKNEECISRVLARKVQVSYPFKHVLKYICLLT